MKKNIYNITVFWSTEEGGRRRLFASSVTLDAMKKFFSFSFENLHLEIFKISFSLGFSFEITKKK